MNHHFVPEQTKKRHNWIRIGSAVYKCSACGVVLETRFKPREHKYQLNEAITEYFMNGILLQEQPKCTIEY